MSEQPSKRDEQLIGPDTMHLRVQWIDDILCVEDIANASLLEVHEEQALALSEYIAATSNRHEVMALGLSFREFLDEHAHVFTPRDPKKRGDEEARIDEGARLFSEPVPESSDGDALEMLELGAHEDWCDEATAEWLGLVAEKLKAERARHAEEVERLREAAAPDDNCEVRCPERPDLPVWSTGSIPGEPSRVRFRTKMKPSKLDGWEEP